MFIQAKNGLVHFHTKKTTARKLDPLSLTKQL